MPFLGTIAAASAASCLHAAPTFVPNDDEIVTFLLCRIEIHKESVDSSVPLLNLKCLLVFLIFFFFCVGAAAAAALLPFCALLLSPWLLSFYFYFLFLAPFAL